MCPVGKGKQRCCQSINLRRSKRVLRHLQSRSERSWLPNLGSNVIRRTAFHPRQKNDFGKWLVADARQFGSKIIRLLDSADLMTGRASIVGDQELAVRDLLRSSRLQVNIGQ